MKRRIIILGSVVVAVVALWSAAWLVLAGVVKSNIDALASADGITSPRFSCGTLNIGGYPFRFDVDCREVSITLGDMRWSLPELRASARVYAPTHLLAAAYGPLEFTDSFTGSRNRVAWRTMDASVRLADWRIARLSIQGTDVKLADTVVGETLLAQAPLAEVHLFDIPEAHDAERRLSELSGYLKIDGLSYPAMTLTGTSAEAQLELTSLPDDVRNWGDPALLPAMAANGATLRIISIHGTDGDSVLDADGSLTLDIQGRPEGQVNIRSTGVAERIGPLIQEPWRTLVIGAPGADGTYANQLNFRAGTISSGIIPIATVPPLF